MRIHTLLMSMLLFATQVFGLTGQEGTQVGPGGTPTALRHEEICQRISAECFNMLKFLEMAELRTNKEEAIHALVAAFERQGYVPEPTTGEANIRAGTRTYPVTDYVKAWHFVSDTGGKWIDVILFRKTRAAEEFYLGIKRNKNRYYGSESPTCWVYHTWNDSENSDVGAVFIKQSIFVNIGTALPCPVPMEISLAEKYPDPEQVPDSLGTLLAHDGYRLSESERQTVLSHIKDATETLQAAIQLAITNLVAEEDLASIPKDGEDLFGFTVRNRVAAFMTMWFEVKYNFVFFDQVPDLDWDSVLHRYLPRVERAETEEEFIRLLSECMALLRDGHTGIEYRSGKVDFPNILVRPIEERAIIAELGENDELAQSGLQPGDEITHVDGRPVSVILEKDLYPYICASTSQGRDRKAFVKLLEGPRDRKVAIQVRRPGGEVREVTLTRRSDRSQTPWKTAPALQYRELPGNIIYVALNSFGSRDVIREFDKLFDKKLSEAEGLILDLCENGGGSSSIGYAIIGRLIDKPLPASRWRTRKYMPAFRAWGKEEEWHEGKHPQVEPRGRDSYLGPLVVLTGPGTISAAEDFLIPLHASRRATLVGQKTAGTTGQPLVVDLHGLATARICTKHDTYPDGREFVGIGIVPDVEVHPTQADVSVGRDAILEKGIEVLRSAPK